jgi:hypothetical protein
VVDFEAVTSAIRCPAVDAPLDRRRRKNLFVEFITGSGRAAEIGQYPGWLSAWLSTLSLITICSGSRNPPMSDLTYR